MRKNNPDHTMMVCSKVLSHRLCSHPVVMWRFKMGAPQTVHTADTPKHHSAVIPVHYPGGRSARALRSRLLTILANTDGDVGTGQAPVAQCSKEAGVERKGPRRGLQ